MHSEKYEIVRQTKLDVAQWIAVGIATCRNPVTSLCLARYAAAQLEGAAMLSPLCAHGARKQSQSLLRRALRNTGRKARPNCVAVLTIVSRAMLQTLAGQSSTERSEAMRDLAVARLIRHEAHAAKTLLASLARAAA